MCICDLIYSIYDGLVDDVAYDVSVEPPLQPITGKSLPSSANTDREARLDIAARVFGRGGQWHFLM